MPSLHPTNPRSPSRHSYLLIAAFGLALAVLVLGLLRAPGSRLMALAGALFALSTLGGYILSVWIACSDSRRCAPPPGSWRESSR